ELVLAPLHRTRSHWTADREERAWCSCRYPTTRPAISGRSRDGQRTARSMRCCGCCGASLWRTCPGRWGWKRLAVRRGGTTFWDRAVRWGGTHLGYCEGEGQGPSRLGDVKVAEQGRGPDGARCYVCSSASASHPRDRSCGGSGGEAGGRGGRHSSGSPLFVVRVQDDPDPRLPPSPGSGSSGSWTPYDSGVGSSSLLVWRVLGAVVGGPSRDP